MEAVNAIHEPPVRDQELLGVGDLAARFQVAEKTIRRWRSEGLLPDAIEIAGVIRWRPEVVDRWIEEREG